MLKGFDAVVQMTSVLGQVERWISTWSSAKTSFLGPLLLSLLPFFSSFFSSSPSPSFHPATFLSCRLVPITMHGSRNTGLIWAEFRTWQGGAVVGVRGNELIRPFPTKME